MSSPLAPVIALSHGGGPLPLLGDPGHVNVVRSLRERVPKLLRLGTPQAPRAIVLVTAHWSEDRPTISKGAKPSLYYDYYGFPKETYNLKYDASGSPEVAEEVAAVLRDAGLQPKLDEERGWDHGVFVPMLLVNPSGSVPIVQLSVLTSESPSTHLAVGRALHALRASNIAIVGSGFASLHNMQHMMSGRTREPAFRAENDEWSRAVLAAVQAPRWADREKMFEGWRAWPGAYTMHPRGGAEHFLPLVVCAGAGGEGPGMAYADDMLGLDMYSYYWE